MSGVRLVYGAAPERHEVRVGAITNGPYVLQNFVSHTIDPFGPNERERPRDRSSSRQEMQALHYEKRERRRQKNARRWNR